MIGYLVLCYVDTEIVSHSKKNVDEIIDLINRSDIFTSEYTLLFKDNNFNSNVTNFMYSVPYFLNDPYGMFIEDEFDNYLGVEQEKYEYPEDHMSLQVQFVSSQELYKAFYNRTHGFDIHNCKEFIVLGYTLSMLDQMEILKKLQMPQNDIDKMNKIVISTGDKRKRLLREFNNGHKN